MGAHVRTTSVPQQHDPGGCVSRDAQCRIARLWHEAGVELHRGTGDIPDERVSRTPFRDGQTVPARPSTDESGLIPVVNGIDHDVGTVADQCNQEEVVGSLHPRLARPYSQSDPRSHAYECESAGVPAVTVSEESTQTR